VIVAVWARRRFSLCSDVQNTGTAHWHPIATTVERFESLIYNHYHTARNDSLPIYCYYSLRSSQPLPPELAILWSRDTSKTTWELPGMTPPVSESQAVPQAKGFLVSAQHTVPGMPCCVCAGTSPPRRKLSAVGCYCTLPSLILHFNDQVTLNGDDLGLVKSLHCCTGMIAIRRIIDTDLGCSARMLCKLKAVGAPLTETPFSHTVHPWSSIVHVLHHPLSWGRVCVGFPLFPSLEQGQF